MKKLLIILLCIAAAFALFCGSSLYVTRYRVTDIDAAVSPDGTYEIIFQEVGEPDWPFGYSHARIVLKKGRQTVAKYRFDVANDGGILYPENWTVKWQDTCVQAIISGEEQDDRVYTFYFEGVSPVQDNQN